MEVLEEELLSEVHYHEPKNRLSRDGMYRSKTRTAGFFLQITILIQPDQRYPEPNESVHRSLLF